MIHEIAPEHLDNQYYPYEPDENSRICIMGKGTMLGKKGTDPFEFPSYEQVKDRTDHYQYLFSIDDRKYFSASLTVQELPEDTDWLDMNTIRKAAGNSEAMAGITAMHLINWYRSVQYCGRCGQKAEHDSKERMMRCPACGNMMFPKINPAVVVAVTDGERLLLTRYAHVTQKNSYALVAGFVEIGETAEECCIREVLEEVGVHIKNVKYYKTQPWGVAGNLMMGYTAVLDGEKDITLDRNELAEAVWLTPDEIPDIDDYSSLTREMIRYFKQGKLEF